MDYNLTFFVVEMRERQANSSNRDNHTVSIGHLMMQVCWGNGQRLEVDTGLLIICEGWNSETQRCRRGSLHGADQNIAAWIINRHLSELEQRVGHALKHRSETETGIETSRRLAEMIGLQNRTEGVLHARTQVKSDKQSLQECLEWYIEEQSLLKGWSESTRKKMHELKEYLQAYMPMAQLCDIDQNWLCQFLNSLENYGPENSRLCPVLIQAVV